MNLAAGIILLACSVAAHADVVLEAHGPTGKAIVLYSEPGPCLRDARRAEFVGVNGATTPGCYVFGAVGNVRMIQIVFLDGDAILLPAADFKPPKQS